MLYIKKTKKVAENGLELKFEFYRRGI